MQRQLFFVISDNYKSPLVPVKLFTPLLGFSDPGIGPFGGTESLERSDKDGVEPKGPMAPRRQPPPLVAPWGPRSVSPTNSRMIA